MSPNRAKQIVKVAERRSSFPLVFAAFEAGELTLDQVTEIVKAPAWAEARVLDFATVATVTRPRRRMRSEQFTGDPDEPEPAPTPEAAEPVDRLTFGPTDESKWRINGAVDLATGRRIEAALTEALDSLFEQGDTIHPVFSPHRRAPHRHSDASIGTDGRNMGDRCVEGGPHDVCRRARPDRPGAWVKFGRGRLEAGRTLASIVGDEGRSYDGSAKVRGGSGRS